MTEQTQTKTAAAAELDAVTAQLEHIARVLTAYERVATELMLRIGWLEEEARKRVET